MAVCISALPAFPGIATGAGIYARRLTGLALYCPFLRDGPSPAPILAAGSVPQANLPGGQIDPNQMSRVRISSSLVTGEFARPASSTIRKSPMQLALVTVTRK